MSERETLIARKLVVRRQIEKLTREIEAGRLTRPPMSTRRLRRLEQQMEQLMAEETTLRQAIDRSA